MEIAYNDSFFHVLKYIYTGKLVLNNQEIDRIIDLMSISKTLNLTSLMNDVSLLLMEGITLENVVLIYEKAIKYDQIHVQLSCENFIDKNAEKLVAQKGLLTMCDECLRRIISRDSFSLNEAKIYELVYEWHVFHNRTDSLDTELIETIRIELIDNEELLNLTSRSKLIDDERILRVLRQRLFDKNTNKKPTRRMQASSTISTTNSTTTTTRTTTRITTTTTKQISKYHNYLASGSDDEPIKIWNVETGYRDGTFKGHSRTIYALQVLTNNRLASGSSDKSIKIWNIDTARCIRTLHGHSDAVYSLQTLANNRLASGSADSVIRIWNVDNGECIRKLIGHRSTVYALQLLANNKLASGSRDKSIKIWNLYTGECIRTLDDHSSYVYSVQSLAKF